MTVPCHCESINAQGILHCEVRSNPEGMVRWIASFLVMTDVSSKPLAELSTLNSQLSMTNADSISNFFLSFSKKVFTFAYYL
ncbi:MAG: hypothetical protein LBD53_00235 [Tannerella sp.]|nr:hypothetical protein [Tannerella sp.]